MHTGLSPAMASLSKLFCCRYLCNSSRLPQPRSEDRFGLIRFRSPLLTESLLISFPVVTKMFQFATFARHSLYIQLCVTPSGCPVMPGFPIRTFQDQSPFDGSPELFAAYHVLHRLITPRHPPCTLNSLITFTAGPGAEQRCVKSHLYPKCSKVHVHLAGDGGVRQPRGGPLQPAGTVAVNSRQIYAAC